jgi:hypothetical protein
MTWSDQNAAPNDKADEHTVTLGSVRIDLKGDAVKFAIGSFSLTITESDAVFVVDGVEHKISGAGIETTGGNVRHNGKNIGSDHEHTDVLKGGDLTGPPA